MTSLVLPLQFLVDIIDQEQDEFLEVLPGHSLLQELGPGGEVAQGDLPGDEGGLLDEVGHHVESHVGAQLAGSAQGEGVVHKLRPVHRTEDCVISVELVSESSPDVWRILHPVVATTVHVGLQPGQTSRQRYLGVGAVLGGGGVVTGFIAAGTMGLLGQFIITIS